MLAELFRTRGVPNSIPSDNGPGQSRQTVLGSGQMLKLEPSQ